MTPAEEKMNKGFDEIKTMLTEHIRESNERHRENAERQKETARRLERIDLAVIGDEQIGTSGLVKRVKELEESIEQSAVKTLAPRVTVLEEKELKRKYRELKLSGAITVVAGFLIEGYHILKDAIVHLWEKMGK